MAPAAFASRFGPAGRFATSRFNAGRFSGRFSGLTALASGQLIEGQTYEYAPPAALVSGSGSYSATGLPLGLSIDSSTGVTSGTCLGLQPLRTATITRGVDTEDVDLAVSLQAGEKYLDTFSGWHFNPDLVTYETDVEATNTAEIVSAVATAAEDAGSEGAPKFHRIRYTGPDFANLSGSTAGTVTGSEFTYIVIEAQSQQKFTSTGFGYKDSRILFKDFYVNGYDPGAGSQNLVLNSGTTAAFRDCRLGLWWESDQRAPAHSARPWIAGGFRYADNCEIAGFHNTAFAGTEGEPFLFIDCLIHHHANDTTSIVLPGAGSLSQVLMVGCVQAWNRMTQSGLHNDIIQTKPDFNDCVEEVVVDRCVLCMESSFYASTAIRQVANGTTSTRVGKYQNSLFLTTGYGTTMAVTSGTIDGLIVAPAPGNGVISSQLQCSGFDSINDLICGNQDIVDAVPVGGEDITFTDNDATSLEAQFPNIDGAIVSHVQTGTDLVTRNKYVPSIMTDVALDPDAILSWYADKYEPSGGWSTAFPSPTTYRTRTWPWTAPTVVQPSLTISSATDAEIVFSTDTGDGQIYYITTDNPNAPNAIQIMNLTDADGQNNNAEASGGPLADMPDWGDVPVGASGTQTAETLSGDYSGGTYYVHAVHHSSTGGMSDVETLVVSSSSLIDFSATPTNAPGVGTSVSAIDGGWRWTIAASVADAYISWSTGDVNDTGGPWDFNFTIEADTTMSLNATVSSAAGLTNVRGLNQTLSLTAATPSAESHSVTADGNGDYIGFRVTGNSSDLVIDITDLEFVEP